MKDVRMFPRVQSRPHSDDWGMHVFFSRLPQTSLRADGYVTSKGELVLRDGGQPAEEFLSMDEEAAQLLMNDLWEGGIRPSNGVASTGQLKAMTEHISDLRDIKNLAIRLAERKV